MAEITRELTVQYRFSIDLDEARKSMTELAEDAGDDDDLFEEFMVDYVVANIGHYETLKMMDVLPTWMTHYSVRDES